MCRGPGECVQRRCTAPVPLHALAPPAPSLRPKDSPGCGGHSRPRGARIHSLCLPGKTNVSAERWVAAAVQKTIYEIRIGAENLRKAISHAKEEIRADWKFMLQTHRQDVRAEGSLLSGPGRCVLSLMSSSSFVVSMPRIVASAHLRAPPASSCVRHRPRLHGSEVLVEMQVSRPVRVPSREPVKRKWPSEPRTSRPISPMELSTLATMYMIGWGFSFSCFIL